MPDIFERVLLFKQSPIFSEVKTEDLRAVAQELQEEYFLAGERIFDINEHSDHMYILVTGRVGISRRCAPFTVSGALMLGPCAGVLASLSRLLIDCAGKK